VGRVFFAVVVIGVGLSSVCFAYSGGLGTAENPYKIATKVDLLELAGATADYNKCFILTADIDMAGQVFTMAVIGAANFTGTFDGNDYIITNFIINGDNDCLGLFGCISGGSVKNLGLDNCDVNGSSGYQYVGGLVGDSEDGSISNCYSAGTVGGSSYYVGGLVGYANSSSISNCYSRGDVNGSQAVGGLVGYNDSGSISGCYSIGTISGIFAAIGGLVGYNDSGSINNSYSRGNVSASSPSSSRDIGGLVGSNDGGSIVYCYSTGMVSGLSDVGGLIGNNNMGVDNSFWDMNNSGQASSAGGTGETTAEMKTESTFTDAGWDFTSIWAICEGTNYPRLRWQIPLGDFVCPDGVDFRDFAVLANEWLLREITWDVWPEEGGDGIVNFFDWAVFANQWETTIDYESLADFAEQWLKTGSRYLIAKIAPDDGDGVVDMSDLEVFADNWLEGFDD
jgi:hypothetical protein